MEINKFKPSWIILSLKIVESFRLILMQVELVKDLRYRSVSIRIVFNGKIDDSQSESSL